MRTTSKSLPPPNDELSPLKISTLNNDIFLAEIEQANREHNEAELHLQRAQQTASLLKRRLEAEEKRKRVIQLQQQIIKLDKKSRATVIFWFG